MKREWAVWGALLNREMKVVLRSPQIWMFVMLPILYTIIYTIIGKQLFTAAQVCISMSVSICGVFVQALLIVAEKETNEWRVLNRAGISLSTLLGCKTAVTVVVTLLTVSVCSLMVGYQMLHVMQLLIVLLPVLGSFVTAGIIVGFVCHSMEEILMTKWQPILLLAILVILPVFIPSHSPAWLHAAYQHYPTGILSAAMNVVEEKRGFGTLMALALKACLWVVAVGGVALGLYRREQGRS